MLIIFSLHFGYQEPVNMVSALSDGSLFDSPPMRLQPESEESVVENVSLMVCSAFYLLSDSHVALVSHELRFPLFP